MDLRQRLKVLLREEDVKKKVLGIVKEADRSPKLETSLASVASMLQNKNKVVANQKGKKPMNSNQVSVAEDDHSDG